MTRIHNPLANCRVAIVALLALAASSALCVAQDSTFSGTYTFNFGAVDDYSIQSNMFNQEVGFCPNGIPQSPFGYSCTANLGQEVLTGTLVVNGTGKIITGSNYVFTADPNRYQCSPKQNPAPDCPYKVPAGVSWSSSASYVVGDEVDFTVGGTLLTFQAVTNNTNVPPNASTCTSNIQFPPNCDWDQLYASATGQGGFSGTVTGTYTVQANGSGVMKLTFVTPTGNITGVFAIVVPTAPLAIGQEVSLVGMPQLGNEIRGSGSAVRVK